MIAEEFISINLMNGEVTCLTNLANQMVFMKRSKVEMFFIFKNANVFKLCGC